MFFDLSLIFSSNFTKIVFLQISSEEINQNSLKWQIYQTLKEVKLLVFFWAGTSVTKAAQLFGVARSNDSIWDRRKNIFTEAKLWNKAKTIW